MTEVASSYELPKIVAFVRRTPRAAQGREKWGERISFDLTLILDASI